MQKKDAIQNRVDFLGQLSQQELYETYSKSRYFLFLSQHPNECLPNVVKEAMANGCIPIVSRTFAIEELVNDDVNGFVVDLDDRKRFEGIIKILEDNKSKRNILIHNAQSSVNKNFDANKNMIAYQKIWLDLF